MNGLAYVFVPLDSKLQTLLNWCLTIRQGLQPILSICISGYQCINIYLWSRWTKFKTITDVKGQTITLSIPGDLLEHVQLTGHDDVILQFYYNSNPVFENVYLHPNNSINNLDYITGANSTYFTGQAVLTLSTQSKALFYIVYQEIIGITLHLITTL